MITTKPSQPTTPTGQGRILLIALYQRLQQIGYTPHAVCAMLELMRDRGNTEITPPLPEGRLIPHGEGLALKTANGIRDVSRVYLRPLKSAPPMPWRPEWHAIREAVARADHDTVVANSAMQKSQRRRGPQQKRGHGYDWEGCWSYALTLRAMDAWNWTEHQRDKKQPLPAVRKVVEDKIKDWFERTTGGAFQTSATFARTLQSRSMRAGARGASASVDKRIGGGAQPLAATISHFLAWGA